MTVVSLPEHLDSRLIRVLMVPCHNLLNKANEKKRDFIYGNNPFPELGSFVGVNFDEQILQ